MRESELKKKKKKKKRGEMRVTDEREREREREELIKQIMKRNKILVFCFTIELQCDSTFRIAL